MVIFIPNCRITTSISLHNFLCGFRAGRGTGTASLEAKLIQQLASMIEEVLYAIFMVLHKSYAALERGICLEILEGYGVGLRYCHILRHY